MSEEKINNLRSEIEKHQKHPKIPKQVIFMVLGAFAFFLIVLGIYFSSNQNQIRLTITNGSEVIKRLEVRADNAEKAQVEDRDKIGTLNDSISTKAMEIEKLKNVSNKKDEKIKDLNEKVDSLLRIVNTYQHSDIEPVKRN